MVLCPISCSSWQPCLCGACSFLTHRRSILDFIFHASCPILWHSFYVLNFKGAFNSVHGKVFFLMVSIRECHQANSKSLCPSFQVSTLASARGFSLTVVWSAGRGLWFGEELWENVVSSLSLLLHIDEMQGMLCTISRFEWASCSVGMASPGVFQPCRWPSWWP